MSLLLLFNNEPVAPPSTEVGFYNLLPFLPLMGGGEPSGAITGTVSKTLDSISTTRIRTYGTLRPYSLPHLSWLRRAIDNITIVYQSDSVFAVASEDTWTEVLLISNFTTSSASNTNVTDFNFTPEIDSLYFIEMFLLIQTTDTGCGPQPGISWPSAMVTNGATLFSPVSSTGLTYINWSGSSTANTGSTGLNTANVDYISKGYAILKTNVATTGNFQITLASEDGTNQVQMTAGSFFKYRKLF